MNFCTKEKRSQRTLVGIYWVLYQEDANGVMIIGAENGISQPSSNSGREYVRPLRSDASRKDRDLSLLPHPTRPHVKIRIVEPSELSSLGVGGI